MRNLIFIALFALSAMLTTGCGGSGGDGDIVIDNGNTNIAEEMVEGVFPPALWQGSNYYSATWTAEYYDVGEKRADKIVDDLKTEYGFTCSKNYRGWHRCSGSKVYQGVIVDFDRYCLAADCSEYYGYNMNLSRTFKRDLPASSENMFPPIYLSRYHLRLGVRFQGDILADIRYNELTQFTPADFHCYDGDIDGMSGYCTKIDEDFAYRFSYVLANLTNSNFITEVTWTISNQKYSKYDNGDEINIAPQMVDELFPSADWQSLSSSTKWILSHTNVDKGNMDDVIANLNATGSSCYLYESGVVPYYARCYTSNYSADFYSNKRTNVKYYTGENHSIAYLQYVLLPINGVITSVTLQRIFQGDITHRIKNDRQTQFSNFTCSEYSTTGEMCTNQKNDIRYSVYYYYDYDNNYTDVQWHIERPR